VLLNPTQAEITNWQQGNLGIEGCEDCAALEDDRYCGRCTALRDQFSCAAVVVYGTSHVEGFDFSAPSSALASFDQGDLPSELLTWLYVLPDRLWIARIDDLKKKLPTSATIPPF